MAMSERRTAVRMLHGPCSDNDATGTPTPRCTSPGRRAALQEKPPTPGRQSFRRRSLCFLPPASDEAGCRDLPLSKSVGMPTCSSPATTFIGEVPPKPSVTSSPGCPFDQDSPHHLSVPLTLLSLHNGGARHSPRNLSRDVSPMALLITREGSFSSGQTDADSGDDGAAGGNSAHASATATTSLSGSKSAARERCRTSGSPPKPASTQLSPIASLAAGAPSAGASASPLSPVGGRTPVPAVGRVPTPALAPPGIRVAAAASNNAGSGSGSSRGTSGNIPLPVVPLGGGLAVGAGGADVLHAPVCAASNFLPSNGGAAVTGGGVSGATDAFGGGGGVGGITLPAHLCSHRPPTPVCKEDDLLSSLRHMTSPSRRRSRFASAADSSLLAAAASAIAADEAGLLDSPPGSFTAAAGGGLLVGDPRLRRSAVAGLSESGSLVTAMSGGGGGGLGTQGGEPPASPSLLLRSLGSATAAGLEVGLGSRLPSASASMSMSMSMTWRSSAQLMPVPEEPALPQSHGDPITSASGALGDGGGAAVSGASPALGRLSAGATAATGGGCGVPSSRRLRTNISAVNGSEGGPLAADTNTGHTTGTRSSLRGGAGANSGPLDDSLSSFMHSFGPATPSGDRRSPTAASAPDEAQSVPVAGSGRVTAR